MKSDAITIRPNGDLWDVCDEDGPIEGLTAKPKMVALFLVAWLKESVIGCEKLVAKKQAEAN